MGYTTGIEINSKIEIKIDTNKPIYLKDFTSSVNAIGDIFYATAKEYDTEESYKPSIYISEVRKGSFILDLVCATTVTIPLLIENGITTATFETLKIYFDMLKEAILPTTEKEKTNLKKAGEILRPIAYDDASQINIGLYKDNRKINNYYITGQDAGTYLDFINKINESDSSSKFYNQVAMVWIQTNFKDRKKGNKGIIECISNKSLKVIFNNNDIQHEMTSTHQDFPNELWQNLIYIVDVEVMYIDGEAKYYKILKNYPELTEQK